LAIERVNQVWAADICYIPLIHVRDPHLRVPDISVNSATMNAENAPNDRQSRLVFGRVNAGFDA
jgi:hypothetical protein